MEGVTVYQLLNLQLGIALLGLANFTFTFVGKDGKTPAVWATFARLAIAPVALYAIYDFGFAGCWDCGYYTTLQVRRRFSKPLHTSLANDVNITPPFRFIAHSLLYQYTS